MASKVKLAKGKTFQFSTTGSGGAAKYPWAEWFCGDLLMLERSTPTDEPDAVNDKGTIVKVQDKKDYEVPTTAMFPKTKTAARNAYKIVQMSSRDADGKKLKDAIIIQARDMTPEERTAEDAQRVLDKMRASMKVGDRVVVSAGAGKGITGTIAVLNGSKVDIARDDGDTTMTTGYDRSDLTVQPKV